MTPDSLHPDRVSSGTRLNSLSVPMVKYRRLYSRWEQERDRAGTLAFAADTLLFARLTQTEDIAFKGLAAALAAYKKTGEDQK